MIKFKGLAVQLFIWLVLTTALPVLPYCKKSPLSFLLWPVPSPINHKFVSSLVSSFVLLCQFFGLRIYLPCRIETIWELLLTSLRYLTESAQVPSILL